MLLELAAATSQPDFSSAATPTELVVLDSGTRLELRFEARPPAHLKANELRAACRCAWCTKAKVQGSFPQSFTGMAIEQIRPVGSYAVNLSFSDGHDRGVFPWSYLRQLAQPGN